MPNINDTIDGIDNEIERTENLEKAIAIDILKQTLVMNAVRNLLAVLLAHWVLRSKGTP